MHAFGQVPPGIMDSITAQGNIVYPSPGDYAHALADAIYSVGGDYAKTQLSPPVAATVSIIRAGIEAAMDMPLETLISSAHGQLTLKASQIVSLVGEMIQGSLKIVTAVITAAAEAGLASAGAAAGAAKAIPEIAAIVAQIVSEITGAFVYQEALEAARKQIGAEATTDCVNRLMAAARSQTPTGTGPGGTVVPGDLFRNVIWAYQHPYTSYPKGPRLPLDQGSMYVLFCGAETQGWGIPRAEYDKVKAEAKALGSKAPGIDPLVQRKMWSVIRGIMATTRKPGLGGPGPIGDEGTLLMPVLQDMIYNEWSRGRWDDKWLTAMSNWLTGRYVSKNVTVCAGEFAPALAPAGGCIQLQMNCRGLIQMGPSIWNSLGQWEDSLARNFREGGRKDGKWILPAKKVSPAAIKGVLVVPIKTGAQIKGAYDKANERVQAAETKKGMIAAASVVAAAGAFVGARRLARQRRRRS